MEIIKKLPIWLILLEVPFVFLAYQYSTRDSLAVYDASSHLSQAWFIKEHLWPAFSGFNYLNLLGFDQGLLYPSLFHYLAATVGIWLGVEMGTKIIVAVSLVALPACLYLFVRLFFYSRNAVAFLTAMLLVVVVALPGYFGANLKGLTQIGLLPSFVSLPLVFLFLWSILKSKPSYILSAVFLAAVVLTHLVAALFCLIFYLGFLISKALAGKFNLNLFFPLVAALGLSAFFVLPFIFSYSLTSQSVHIASLLWPNLVVLLLLLVLGWSFWLSKKEKLLPSLFTALFLALLVLIDAFVLRFLSTGLIFEKIYNLHLYRYQAYLYLLIVPLVLYWPAYLLFEIPRRAKIRREAVVLLPILVLYFAFFVRAPFPIDQVEVKNLDQSNAGRFLETFSREDAAPMEYAAQNQLVTERETPWAYGLFTDSNPNGPYLGSLIRSFDPFKQKNRQPEKFVERKSLDRARIYDLLDLLGIEQLLFLDPNEAPSRERIQTRLLRSGVGQDLVEVPDLAIKQVNGDWEKQIEEWWFERGQLDTLLVKSKEKRRVTTTSATVKNIQHNRDWTKFSFSVDSRSEVPVLVKFTHLPGWQAKTREEKVKIYTASPYLMLIYAKGEVEFQYQKLWYQHLGLAISVFTVVFLLLKSLQKQPPKNAKK
jgi:hypothetical protein